MDYALLIAGNLALLALLLWVRRTHAKYRAAAQPTLDLTGALEGVRGEIAELETERRRLEDEAAVQRDALDAEHAGARALLERLGPAVDYDAEIEALGQRSQELRAAQHRWETTAKQKRTDLQEAYAKARSVHERLLSEISVLEENLTDISFGLYRPHFEYSTSADYKAKLTATNQRLKQMVRRGEAIDFSVEWTVGGSREAGERMQRQYGKVMLRALNGECEAAQAKVSWNNIQRMEKRVEKAYDAVNALGQVMRVTITAPYKAAWLESLQLKHEMEEKRREEREQQRRLREEMREEQKAQRELEQAQREAEVDETRYEKALARAREKMERALGEQRADLEGRVAKLQAELEEARQKKERAISRAQLTKSGHVYIISNVGSFGEDIIKIGMSRRLEPLDRVRELGGASVPFGFDVHGMIYSENAPALEAELHRQFDQHRVNPVNRRREFFRVPLNEIGTFVRTQGLEVELTLLAEAKEYRQAMAMHEEAEQAGRLEQDATDAAAEAAFPDQLFQE